MNAVEEADQSLPENYAVRLAERRRIEPYIFNGGKRPAFCHHLSKQSILLQVSEDLGRDVDMYFDRYVTSTEGKHIDHGTSPTTTHPIYTSNSWKSPFARYHPC
jgi:hypothetical protein